MGRVEPALAQGGWIGDERRVPRWVRDEHAERYVFAAQFVSGKRVVECACGAGLWSARLAEAGAAQLDAFDRSEEAVRRARSRVRHRAAAFHVADATALPLAGACAEVFVSLETIEHLDDDRGFLAEAARVLRPDGVFICSTPNRSLTNPGRRLEHRPWNRWHVREYAQREFVELLAGRFAVVELYGQHPSSRWAAGSLRMIGRPLPAVGALLGRFGKLGLALAQDDAPHRVVPAQPDLEYEFLVAVCRRPRRDGDG